MKASLMAVDEDIIQPRAPLVCTLSCLALSHCLRRSHIYGRVIMMDVLFRSRRERAERYEAQRH